MKKTLLILLILSSAVFAGRSRYLRPRVNTRGLAAHYKLWAGPTSDSRVFDYSLNGNVGLVDSALPKYPGYWFDGSDDYIDTSSAFQATFRASFTISCWIKPDDGQPVATEKFMGTKNSASEDMVYFHLDTTGAIRFYIESNNAGQNRDTAAVMADGAERWHHVVGVAVADDYMDVVFNGTPTGHVDASALTFADWTSSDNVYIGAGNNNGATENEFAGSVDDVMIFNRALSDAEIKGIYEASRWRFQK